MIEYRLNPSLVTSKNSTVVGYAATFNTRTTIQTRSGKSFVEYIAPGAFKNALNGNVVLTRNHNRDIILGRTPKTLQLVEDERGLGFASQLDTDPSNHEAAYTRRMIEREELVGCSFAFETVKDTWTKENGVAVRCLQEVKLSDVAIVTDPAYGQTSLQLRSADVEIPTIYEPQELLEIEIARMKMLNVS